MIVLSINDFKNQKRAHKPKPIHKTQKYFAQQKLPKLLRFIFNLSDAPHVEEIRFGALQKKEEI